MRNTTEIPLSAHVGAWAQQHIEAFLLTDFDEARNIILRRAEIKRTVLLFDAVPHYVCRDGVHAHGSGHLDPVAPVLVWDACWVHLAYAQLYGFSVDNKFISTETEPRDAQTYGEEHH